MKNLMPLIYFVCILGSYQVLNAQKSEKSSPIYDYSEHQLNNTDTIPDFASKPDKLKITGIIYESDGKTPAKDVILYVCQSNEYGDYELKRDENRKRYVHHRGWVKTDADGRYTIYTFMPGKSRHVKELKQIHRIIKVPGKPEQELNAFFFKNDPLIKDLTLACRENTASSMFELKKQGNMFVATRDIKLESNLSSIQ